MMHYAPLRCGWHNPTGTARRQKWPRREQEEDTQPTANMPYMYELCHAHAGTKQALETSSLSEFIALG